MSHPKGWKIALDRITDEKKAKSGFLDLGGLGLTEPPDSLFELEHLEQLHLGSDWYVLDGKLKTTLSGIEKNDIGAKFASLNRLPLLTNLILSGGNLDNLSPLKGLLSLQSLSISGMQITDLTPITHLTRLQTLNCGVSGVTDLSPLTQLPQLHTLRFPFSQISDLTPIRGMKRLQWLDCGSTQVSDLTPLKGLSQLQQLLCTDTQVFDLTPLKGLTKLEKLYCRNTQVSDLSPLSGLNALKELDCSDSQVSDLSPLRKLAALQSLNCSNTQIKTVPEWLVRMPNLKNLVISSDQIQGIPPEVLSRNSTDNCLDRLRAHFDDLAKGSETQSDVKMIVIGNGQIGKTQICRRLGGDDFDESVRTTHGIVVRTIDGWTMDGVPGRQGQSARLHLWDFGGQELYHGTHRLFFQSNAIFMIVWAANSENEQTHSIEGMTFRNHELPYWIENVRFSAGIGQPVLIVQNQCEEPSQEIKPLPPVEKELLANFRMYEVLQYSAKNDRKRATLDEAIRLAIDHEWTNRGQYEIPKGRLRVMREIEKLKHGNPNDKTQTLRPDEFEEICKRDNDISSPEMLLQYLNDSGVLIYRPGLFDDAIILDHAWALEAVYSVFDRMKSYRILKNAGGRFTRSDLEFLVWKNYTQEEQNLFLSWMVKCGLCFVHRKGDSAKGIETEYIAPDLLPKREQVQAEVLYAWESDQAHVIGFDVVLSFLHPALMRGLISLVGNLSGVAPTYWIDGFGFFDTQTNSRCLIEQKRDDRPGIYGGRLEVRTRGGNAGRLLEVMQGWLKEILIREIGRCQEVGWSIVDAPGLMQPPSESVQISSRRVEHFPNWEDGTNGESARNTAEPPISPGFDPSRKQTYGISYAWKRPESQMYAKEIWEEAQRKSRECLYDRKNLTTNNSFQEFVEKLSRDPQRRLLVILSDGYLKSDNCLHELHAVWESSRKDMDFMARIRFFLMDDVDISKPESRNEYVIYWKNRAKEVEDLYAKLVQSEISGREQEERRRYKKISETIGEILLNFQDRIYTRDFEEFKRIAFEEDDAGG